jgi:hypothetical protein
MSALGELEKFGYLTRQRVTDDKGRFAGVEYNIFEIPQPENPISEKSNSANSNEDKSNSEKPAQLNTYLINHLYDLLFTELNTNDPELIAAYREYIQARENMNAPLTEAGLIKLIERAKRLSNGDVRVEKILLESAIINNWKNIYPPRESELTRLNAEMQDKLRSLFGLEE